MSEVAAPIGSPGAMPGRLYCSSQDLCKLQARASRTRVPSGSCSWLRSATSWLRWLSIGLQVHLATPPDKAGGLLPHVDGVRTVIRQDNDSFVLEIDKRQVEA